MEYIEIKDLCKYSGQDKCPINFCSCNAEYCPLVPDTCDCEDNCDKVDNLRYQIRSANCALCKEKNKSSNLETNNILLQNKIDTLNKQLHFHILKQFENSGQAIEARIRLRELLMKIKTIISSGGCISIYNVEDILKGFDIEINNPKND